MRGRGGRESYATAWAEVVLGGMRKRDRRMHRFGKALAHGDAVKIAIGHLVDEL